MGWVGGGVVTTMVHQPTQNPAIYGVLACLYNMCRRMLDVQQHEGVVTSVHDFCERAQIPARCSFFASLYNMLTCYRRMFDVQQHEALPQVFMPFCKHAQNPAIFSDSAPLDKVRLMNTSTAGSGARSWMPKRMSGITWETYANMSALSLSRIS